MNEWKLVKVYECPHCGAWVKDLCDACTHKCEDGRNHAYNYVYDTVSNRLWEKIEYHKDKLDLEAVDLKVMRSRSPLDQLAEKSPLIRTLIAEVDDEFNYEVSEHQASWAIVQAMIGDLAEYNRCQKLSLFARP